MSKTKETFCVIDDDLIHQFIIKKMIAGIPADFEKNVLVFSNGLEAITYLKNAISNHDELPDIILLDINMPIMNGWQFLEQYKSIFPSLNKKITIYILSSSDNPHDIARVKEFKEVSGYFIKPITENELEKLMTAI
ncbi:response regulator [Aquimarina brevivitae]|uniref:Response regulator receiver domain-containing protein n=1 Tax=Aquimarina brevivitae TaxID=323412 RepID=A0A4Q7PIC4_9FLAO|nr:response regulator [Aquimarina brevivitae]RZT00327.1 response regulator receiver domain-containing protein [Aquimarina brevivitae]